MVLRRSMAVIEMAESLQRVVEQPSELSVEERNLRSVSYGNTAGSRRAAWRIIAGVEQKEKFKGMEQQDSHATEYVAKVADEIWRIRDGILAFMDENLIPKRLNFVKDAVDSEDLHLNVYRGTLQLNKILRVIKMNLAKKYLEMLAEIAEKKDDDYKKFHEQFGKRLSLGIHEAELLRFNTSKSGEEQISFEEYVDRMREGQNDMYCITGESIAVVSSRSFRELSHEKGYEVLFMADPVDEFAVQQPKESDRTKPKSTTKEDLEADIAKQSSVELNPFKRETAVSRSNGMDGDVAELHADLGDRLHQLNIDPMRVDEAMQQTASTQQPHRSQQRHQQQAVQRNKREEAKRQGEREEERRGEKGRGENGRRSEEQGVRKEGEKGGSKVVEDVTGWVEVRRRTRRKVVEEGHEGEGEKNCRKAVQIFVKVDGMKTVLREVSPEDKVQKILNIVSGSDQDVYATCEGRMLRKDDELRSCGVSDGCTIQVMSKMRGGGKHKGKTSKAEKKRDRTQRRRNGREGRKLSFRWNTIRTGWMTTVTRRPRRSTEGKRLSNFGNKDFSQSSGTCRREVKSKLRTRFSSI